MNNTQPDMFPKEKRRADLRHDIPRAYGAAESAMRKLSEHNKFLKTFGDYMGSLNAENHAHVVRENCKVAQGVVADMAERLRFIDDQVRKAEELTAEMEDIEREMKVPEDQRWVNRNDVIPDDEEAEEDFEPEPEDPDDEPEPESKAVVSEEASG